MPECIKDGSPQGLYIENSKILSPLDTTNAEGNFYLKPNGVFLLLTKILLGFQSLKNLMQKM